MSKFPHDVPPTSPLKRVIIQSESNQSEKSQEAGLNRKYNRGDLCVTM